MDERFAQDLIAAARARTDFGGSPNQTAANAGQMANLQNLAQLSMGDARTAAAASAFAGDVSNTVSREEQEREAARRMADILAKREQAIIDEEIRKADAATNPDNYKRVIADDGGYRFYDAQGREIDAMKYARDTNQRITDVLKGSENPRDQEYIRGYEEIRDLNFALKGSEEDEKKFFEKHPGIAGRFNELVQGGLSREEALRTITEAFGRSFAQSDQRTVRGLSNDAGNIQGARQRARSTPNDADGDMNDDRWWTLWW